MNHLHAVPPIQDQLDLAPEDLLGEAVSYPLVGQQRLAGPEAEGLTAHVSRWGNRPNACGADGDRLVDTIQKISLTGRGGGHFPSAIKWRAVLAAGGGGIVVANGAEGEPASAKDAALIQHRPHLVLDGLASAAETVGATESVVWLHEGASDSHLALVRALAERRAAGLIDPTVRIATGPRHYLSGESSAVVRALSGGPALPAFRRHSAAEDGVNGRPTLLHNVETLVRVAVAARTGSHRYRGTTLLTVVSDRRTVIEAQPTMSIGKALGTVPQAVLLGGYGGQWAPWNGVKDLPVDEMALRRAGFSLGAGVVAGLPSEACGLATTAALLDYLAASSARQCGPCIFGLRAVADTTMALARGRAGRSDLRRLQQQAGEVSGRGACHHPDGGVRLLRSALTTFADDVQAHVKRHRCLHSGEPAPLPIPEVGAP